MTLIVFLSFLVLFKPVESANTIGVSMDAAPVELCVTADFQNYSCSQSEILVLDGTKDYHLYMSYRQEFTNETSAYMMDKVIKEPVSLITTTSVLVLLVIFSVMLTIFVYYLSKR